MDFAKVRKELRSILSQPAWIVPILALLSVAGGLLKNLVTIGSAPQQIRELQVEVRNQEQSLAVTDEKIDDLQGRLERIEKKLDQVEPEVIVRRYVYRDQQGPPGALTRSQVRKKSQH